MLERAIKGYQFSEPFLRTKGDITARTNAASAAARGAQARMTKRTIPGKAAGAKGGGLKLPSGYKVVG